MTANVELNPSDWPSADLWRTAAGREQDSDVVILPENNKDLETGVYGGELVDLLEELRTSGMKVSFAHDPDAQQWRERKGHGEVSIILSVAETAPWDDIKDVVSRLFPADQLQVFIKSRSKDGLKAKVRLRGRGKDVAEALGQLPASWSGPGDPSPAGPVWGS